MSHGVHAVHHGVEHQIEHEEHGHGGRGKPVGESRNKKIALLISVIALFLALAELISTYGEEPAALYAEKLSARIRNGEFSVEISRQ